MKKLLALALALLTMLTFCQLTVFAETAAESTSGGFTSDSFVGQWYGSKMHSDYSFQQYSIIMNADMTGYYIDTADEDIISYGKSPEMVWSIDGSTLTVQYWDKTAVFEIVINNGFLNLQSSTGIILTRSEAEGEDADNSQAEAAKDVDLSRDEKYVVLEENGVKITYAGEGSDTTNMMSLSVIIENNSDYNIHVKCSAVANGWQTNTIYTGGVISTGAKAKQNVYIYHSDVDFTSYREIETLQLDFTVEDEYKNTLFEKKSDILHLSDGASAAESAAPLFEKDAFLGEWIEINNRDTILLDNDGSGKSTYIIWKSANVHQDHIDERFTWDISGNTLIVNEGRDAFREDIGGGFDIVQDGDSIRLEKNGLVFVKPPRTTNLKIGETVQTDMMSFTLTQFQMAQEIYVNPQILPIYLMPCTDGTGYNAGDNEAFALPVFRVMNLDKDPISGDAWEIMINYNDGYVYYGNGSANITNMYIDGAGFGANKAPEITPLVEGEGRTAIKVAKILQEDNDAPLKLIVRLPSHEFGVEYFEYDLRATDMPEESDSSADEMKEYSDKATVKAVQQALNDAGYNCGTPDGIAGKNTAKAITAYQADNGLKQTGTITGQLLSHMGIAH